MDRSLNALKALLLVSLLVNAAVVGFIVARITGGADFGHRPPGFMREVRQQQQQNAQDEIPPRTREILNQAFEAERPAMETALREWVQARRRAVQILRAPTFDANEFDAAVGDMRIKIVAAQEVYQRIISKSASQLTPDQRVLLARILEPQPGRFAAGGLFGPPAPPPGQQRGPGAPAPKP